MIFYSDFHCTTPSEIYSSTHPISFGDVASDGVGVQFNSNGTTASTITALTSAAASELTNLNNGSSNCSVTFQANTALDVLHKTCDVETSSPQMASQSTYYGVVKLDTSETPNRLYFGDNTVAGKDGSSASARPTTYDILMYYVKQ